MPLNPASPKLRASRPPVERDLANLVKAKKDELTLSSLGISPSNASSIATDGRNAAGARRRWRVFGKRSSLRHSCGGGNMNFILPTFFMLAPEKHSVLGGTFTIESEQ